MNRKIAFPLMAAAAVLLSSCGAPRIGSVFTNIQVPVTVGVGKGARVGTSTSRTYVGVVAVGDASISAAKRNGGITVVSSVDERIHSIMGIVTTYTTIVRGN